MKKIIIAVGVALALTALALYQKPVEYVAPTVETPVEVIKKDSVSEAQRQLDEAKKLLDEEETKILAEIKEKEARLEEIRKVRLSFSQAPSQQE